MRSYKKNNKYYAKKEPITRYWKLGTEINAIEVGSPTVNGAVVSGFSSGNYLTIPYINSIPLSYESVIKFTTSSSWNASVDTECIGFNNIDYTGCRIVVCTGRSQTAGALRVSIGSGSSWNNIVKVDDYILSNATTYWIKTTWDGEVWRSYISTDGDNYTQIGDDLIYDFGALLTSNQILGNATGSWSGKNYFTGSIDLKECYIKLNGNVWWRGVKVAESTQDDYDFTTQGNKYYAFR